MLIHLPLISVIANPPHPCNPCLPSALGFRPSNFSSHAPRFEHVLALGRGPLDSGQVRLGWVTGLRERTKMSNVTSHRITGIRAICYIPGVPIYHPAPSRPSSGLQSRLRGIPCLLPTPGFGLHSSVRPCSAVHPSSSRLSLCYVTNPKAAALKGCRKRVPTVVLRYCPGSTTVAAPC